MAVFVGGTAVGGTVVSAGRGVSVDEGLLPPLSPSSFVGCGGESVGESGTGVRVGMVIWPSILLGLARAKTIEKRRAKSMRTKTNRLFFMIFTSETPNHRQFTSV
jgi:hypothetical protein